MLSGRSAPASPACRSRGGNARGDSGGPSRSSAARVMRISSFSVSSSSLTIAASRSVLPNNGRTKTENPVPTRLLGGFVGSRHHSKEILAESRHVRRQEPVDPSVGCSRDNEARVVALRKPPRDLRIVVGGEVRPFL